MTTIINTEHLVRCIATLEGSIKKLSSSIVDSIDYEIFRNATIKGFELTLETSGKLLKKALQPYFASNKEVEQLYFKDIFRHAAKHGLLSTQEVERWFIYRDNRNSTAHDYGVAFAEETLTLLTTFIVDVKSLQKVLSNVVS